MRFWRGFTMMNIVALAMLLSSLGSAMLLSPEPMLVRSPEDGESPLQAMKEAAQGTYETAEHAKESIVDGVTRPLEKGLGWFRRKPPTPEDRLASAREKAAEAREAFEEASAQLRDAAVGKATETGMTFEI